MGLSTLVHDLDLAAAVVDGAIAAAGPALVAALGRDPTGEPARAIGATDLGPGQVRDVWLRDRALRLRGVQIDGALVLVAIDVTDLRPLGATPSVDGAGLRIVVADDNDLVRDVLVRLLADLGHRPTAVTDVETAIAAARDDHDLMLLDLSMPGGGGLVAARTIRAEERRAGQRRLPIAAVTAALASEDEVLTAGIDAYLLKPVTASELIALCEACRRGDLGPPIDFAAFVRRVGGHRAIAADIAAVFRDNLAGVTGELTAAIAEGGAARIAERAHSLRGALVQIAATRGEQLARAIETAATEPRRCAELLVALRRELARAGVELAAFAADPACCPTG